MIELAMFVICLPFILLALFWVLIIICWIIQLPFAILKSALN